MSLYASRQKIYPRSVAGFFSKWRWLTVWITQIVFYGLPWLQWNARQAVRSLQDVLTTGAWHNDGAPTRRQWIQNEAVNPWPMGQKPQIG